MRIAARYLTRRCQLFVRTQCIVGASHRPFIWSSDFGSTRQRITFIDWFSSVFSLWRLCMCSVDRFSPQLSQHTTEQWVEGMNDGVGISQKQPTTTVNWPRELAREILNLCKNFHSKVNGNLLNAKKNCMQHSDGDEWYNLAKSFGRFNVFFFSFSSYAFVSVCWKNCRNRVYARKRCGSLGRRVDNANIRGDVCVWFVRDYATDSHISNFFTSD